MMEKNSDTCTVTRPVSARIKHTYPIITPSQTTLTHHTSLDKDTRGSVVDVGHRIDPHTVISGGRNCDSDTVTPPATTAVTQTTLNTNTLYKTLDNDMQGFWPGVGPRDNHYVVNNILARLNWLSGKDNIDIALKKDHEGSILSTIGVDVTTDSGYVEGCSGFGNNDFSHQSEFVTSNISRNMVNMQGHAVDKDLTQTSSTLALVVLSSTPFTCAQRANHKFTFLYCSPGAQTHDRSLGLTPLLDPFSARIGPQFDQSQDTTADFGPDTTLDILRSLEDTSSDQGPPYTQCARAQEKAYPEQRAPLIRLKRRNMDTIKLSSQNLNVETILTSPLIPNKRTNTKRTSDSPDSLVESSSPMDIVDFVKGVTAGTLQGNTHPRTPVSTDWKYQKVPTSRLKKVSNPSPPLSPQDDGARETAHYFLSDKSDQDKDNWYIGRRELGCATKHGSRRSFLRQAFNHHLLTDWSTSHATMPPWLRDEDLDTRVFEIKAKAARDIMKESMDYLSGVIDGLEKLSAASLAKVEKKFTPKELLASRAALTEHGRIVSEPLKQVLSEKREYLRRNQPSLDDLITMRHRERDFPKKSNPPPQKKRAPSAALGKAPDSRNPKRKSGPRAARALNWADESNDNDEPRGRSKRGNFRDSPRPDTKKPRRDPSREGGNFHYNDDSDEKENSRRGTRSRRSRSRESTPKRRRSTSREVGQDRSNSTRRAGFQKSGRGRSAPRQNQGDQGRNPSTRQEKPRGQKPSRRPRRK